MGTLTDAMTAALIHSLWQDALVGVLLAIVLALLRRRSANSRYLTACAGLALMTALPVWTATTAYRQLSLPVPRPEAVSATDEVVRFVYSPETAARPVEAPAPHDWRARSMLVAQTWALPLWVAGVLLFSIRGVFAGTHAAALTRRGAVADDATAAIVARLASRLGVQRPVRVLMAGIAEGPATLGWLKPIILLPPAAALGLTTQQFESLLTHELAHIRRHDYLVNVVQMVVETLFFYHPAIWYASRRIRLERELCCDDIVVSTCGDAVGYARALTRVARVRVSEANLAVAAGGGSLLHRIQRLLQPPPRRAVSRWPAVMTILIIASTATTISARWLDQRAEPAARTGTISGYVYDPLGEPAVGITMTLDNNVIDQDKGPFGPPVVLETRTDSFGLYRFEDLAPGAYVLAPAVDWAKSMTVWAPPGGSVQHDVWIAFETVATAIFINLNPRGPVGVREPPAPLDGTVTGPRHFRRANLAYPQGLRVAGDVIVEGHIGADGLPKGLRVVSAADPELARPALGAVQDERWVPARVRGVPIEVPLRLTVVFRMGPF